MSFRELYDATWKQITKDFAHFCEVPNHAAIPSPEQMLESIMEMLNVLSSDALKLNTLFYRIDLSERQQIPNGNPQALAMMILRREAQKVWIRSQYNTKAD
jgi:hypothetical protein